MALFDFWFGGGFPWNVLNVLGVLWGIFMYVYAIPELFGRRWHLKSPHLRKTGLTWDAVDVASCGILTAVNIVLYMTLGGIPLVPGVPAFTAGWVIGFGFWAAFPILFGAGVGGLANGLATLIVDPLVGAPPFSLNGFIRTIVIASFLSRTVGNDPDKAFGSAKKWAQYIVVGLVLAWLLNNNLWIVQMSVLGFIPAEINYVATYLTPAYPLYLVVGFYILGPIFTRAFGSMAKRFGLLAIQRRKAKE